MELQLYIGEMKHSRIFENNSRCVPGGSFMAEKAPKCPKMAKNDTFCLITFDPSIVFPETWSKCGGNCIKYKTTDIDLGKILVRVPGDF